MDEQMRELMRFAAMNGQIHEIHYKGKEGETLDIKMHGVNEPPETFDRSEATVRTKRRKRTTPQDGSVSYERVENAFRVKIEENPGVDLPEMKELLKDYLGCSVRTIERRLEEEAAKFNSSPEDLFAEMVSDVEEGLDT